MSEIMDRTYKILIAHNYYQIPGGEDVVVANEKYMLEENGHQVYLYTRDNSEIKEFTLLQKMCFPFAVLFSLKTYREIKKVIQKEAIDILHVHNTLSLISPAVYLAGLKCGVPVVQTLHNFRIICPNALLYRDGHICEDCLEQGMGCALRHKCYRGSYAQTLVSVLRIKVYGMLGIYKKINYICITNFNKNKIIRKALIQSDRIFVKPNFTTDINCFIEYNKRHYPFIFVGRIEEIKGIKVILEAWRILGNNAPKLLVCGNGPLEGWCQEYIERYHLAVEMRGYVPNDKVRYLIADSRVLIQASQVYEAFSLTIIEAYSVGTAVLGSNRGNVRDLVQDGVTGMLFDTESPESLAEKVLAIRDRDMSEECKKNYLGSYSVQSNYKRLMEIYRKVAGK